VKAVWRSNLFLLKEPNEKHKGNLWAECEIFLTLSLVIHPVTTRILKVKFGAYFYCHYSGYWNQSSHWMCARQAVVFSSQGQEDFYFIGTS
jgi:hypothetical protein